MKPSEEEFSVSDTEFVCLFQRERVCVVDSYKFWAFSTFPYFKENII
jgi:hypothetical protein